VNPGPDKAAEACSFLSAGAGVAIISEAPDGD